MDDIDMQTVNRYIPQKDFLFFLGNTDPKKNTARVLKAYSLYLEKSSVRRPLLIADLNETYIDRLLQQENISNRLKRHLFYPGYIHNADLATERANTVSAWVTGPGTVLSRGEQTALINEMIQNQKTV